MSSDTQLSELLRTATRAEHEHAETRTFVTDLMSGLLDRDAYTDLLFQHHAIYTALEAAGERLAADPVVAGFAMPELLRLPSIVGDLETLLGAGWADRGELCAATRTYVERLESIDDAAGYVAHAYTRYLGDLSGGQVISRMLQRHYDMVPAELTFYTFTGIPKVKPFKDGYRALLDAAPFGTEERERALAETRLAFDLNAAVFVELGTRHTAAELQPA